jgi:replication factor A1
MPKRFMGRGRPVHSDKIRKTLEYLALIAVKYDVNPREFLDYIKEAYDKEETTIKLNKLEVICRQKKVDSAILLFTEGSKVIAQFPILTVIFKFEKQLQSYMTTIQERKSRTRKILNPKIKDLRVGLKNVHLIAKVIEIPEPNLVYTRLGTQAYVSNILISDETGTIRMSLWDRQIHSISKDDTIEVNNGTVASFRGELQLRMGRRGRLNVIK